MTREKNIEVTIPLLLSIENWTSTKQKEAWDTEEGKQGFCAQGARPCDAQTSNVRAVWLPSASLSSGCLHTQERWPRRGPASYFFQVMPPVSSWLSRSQFKRAWGQVQTCLLWFGCTACGWGEGRTLWLNVLRRLHTMRGCFPKAMTGHCCLSQWGINTRHSESRVAPLPPGRMRHL